jgi:periplasmic protein TonB
VNLERFFIYSSVAHALLIAALLLLIPAEQGTPKKGELFTRLVSPEELLSGRPAFIPRSRTEPPQKTHSRSRAMKPKTIPDRSIAGIIKQKEPPRSNGAVLPGAPGVKAGEQPEIKQSGPKEGKPGPAIKDQLFDRGVIGDIAKQYLDKEEKEKKDRTFTFDTKQYRFLIYNQRLKQRIESIWVYPRRAAAQGIYGDLVIKFTILQNGNLGAVELIRTSGHKDLDDAAIKALYDGAPYWPLPKEWGMESYTIEGLFIYTLYGSYIM